MKAGFIGLGGMGLGMASNLAKAGYLTVVYNRTVEKAESFAQTLAITVATTPEALAALVDVIFICVSADQDVLTVVSAIAKNARPGTIVVDMSTISADTALQAADMLAAKQVDFLDAPVSGGVEGAKNGALAMMIGGNATTIERISPLLQTMATRILHMGPTGAGQATKAVNQIMCAGITQAVTEALAFAKAQQLPMDKVLEVVSGGACGNWFLQHRGNTMTNGTFLPGFKLALHHKDLKICQTMAKKIAFTSPLTDMTILDYEQLMQQGYGEEDISALYRLKTKQATFK